VYQKSRKTIQKVSNLWQGQYHIALPRPLTEIQFNQVVYNERSMSTLNQNHCHTKASASYAKSANCEGGVRAESRNTGKEGGKRESGAEEATQRLANKPLTLSKVLNFTKCRWHLAKSNANKSSEFSTLAKQIPSVSDLLGEWNEDERKVLVCAFYVWA